MALLARVERQELPLGRFRSLWLAEDRATFFRDIIDAHAQDRGHGRHGRTRGAARQACILGRNLPAQIHLEWISSVSMSCTILVSEPCLWLLAYTAADGEGGRPCGRGLLSFSINWLHVVRLPHPPVHHALPGSFRFAPVDALRRCRARLCRTRYDTTYPQVLLRRAAVHHPAE